MRAFLLSFVIALAAVFPARAQDSDPNAGIRQYVNGTWVLTFSEDVKPGGPSDIKKVATIITITMRYDGTRTIVMDQQLDDRPPVRASETNDYYRVDEVDGTRFTLTSWSDTDPPKTTNRTRTGADEMMTEGSDAIYRRVPGSQEGLLGPMPPQRTAPGGGGQPPAPQPTAAPTPAIDTSTPPAAPAPLSQEQQARDAALRAFIIGRWTATVTQNGQTIESILDYHASGRVRGTQRVSANGKVMQYEIDGAYTIVSTGDRSFTMTFYLPGLQPAEAKLEIVDDNTLFNPAENYRATRAP